MGMEWRTLRSKKKHSKKNHGIFLWAYPWRKWSPAGWNGVRNFEIFRDTPAVPKFQSGDTAHADPLGAQTLPVAPPTTGVHPARTYKASKATQLDLDAMAWISSGLSAWEFSSVVSSFATL